jgi:hypothetical protein
MPTQQDPYPPMRVETDRGHWSRGRKLDSGKKLTYDDYLIYITEAVGRLAFELNDYADPNSPWAHQAVAERAEEIARWANDLAAAVYDLVGRD